MEAEVTEVVGARGRHLPEREAQRHGHEDGRVTLGGRRVAVKRPRVRSADGAEEVPLSTYEHFAERDPLTRAVMDRMLAGASARRYASVGEPAGSRFEEESSSTSASAVSRAFVERTRTGLGELMSRRLDHHPPSGDDDRRARRHSTDATSSRSTSRMLARTPNTQSQAPRSRAPVAQGRQRSSSGTELPSRPRPVQQRVLVPRRDLRPGALNTGNIVHQALVTKVSKH